MNLQLDGDGQFRARPESHLTSTRLVDTGVRPGVKEQRALGLELAGARGPLTLRSEIYMDELGMECYLEHKDGPPVTEYKSQYEFIIRKLNDISD